MPKSIDEIELTIFDTETTGLEPKSGDRIVEIAGLRFQGKRRISHFQSLVDPGRPISEAAFAVNKISTEMLKGAPRIEEVLPRFLSFSQGSCLCSYNATFDLDFLNSELEIMGKGPVEDVIVVDILKMAKRILPAQERYALWFIADRLGIKTQQLHRASSDVELTFEVFQRLKGILQQKGILEFQMFSGLFSINSRQTEDAIIQKVSQIQEAIDLGVRLKIRYLSSSGAEVSEREVIPKKISQENNRSYLVGYCCLRKDERTFRIDGILHLEVV
jgi:DNA polymerase III epsilon subunit